MWHDDGDWETYHNRDEDAWERHRDGQCIIVMNLIDFLAKLRILRNVPDMGYDTASFVDRNWKA